MNNSFWINFFSYNRTWKSLVIETVLSSMVENFRNLNNHQILALWTMVTQISTNLYDTALILNSYPLGKCRKKTRNTH